MQQTQSPPPQQRTEPILSKLEEAGPPCQISVGLHLDCFVACGSSKRHGEETSLQSGPADRAIIILTQTILASADGDLALRSLCRPELEGGGMIKGIVGCRVRKDRDLEPILLKLKSHATQYHGFKGMENLVSSDNASVIAMVSTWESPEAWKSWIESTITKELLRQAEALLVEEPRLTTYRTMTAAVMWV